MNFPMRLVLGNQKDQNVTMIYLKNHPFKNYPPRKENNSPPGEILEKKNIDSKSARW